MGNRVYRYQAWRLWTSEDGLTCVRVELAGPIRRMLWRAFPSTSPPVLPWAPQLRASFFSRVEAEQVR